MALILLKIYLLNMSSGSPINGLPDEFQLLYHFKSAVKTGSLYTITFRTQGKEFKIFSRCGSGRIQTKEKQLRGIRMSCKIESDSSNTYHSISVSESNFPKFCGLFHLIGLCKDKHWKKN